LLFQLVLLQLGFLRLVVAVVVDRVHFQTLTQVFTVLAVVVVVLRL
jgi:hypothetical protein